MSRPRLVMPDAYPFETEIPVRISDVNYAGHLGNDRVLSVLHEARIRWLASLGFTELDCGGAGIVVRDAAIEYRSEAFHGERLLVAVAPAEPGGASCDVYYRVRCAADGRLVVNARTGLAFFDFAKRALHPMPAAFRAKVTGG
jgi:acyl-CoA thioester hydrolase